MDVRPLKAFERDGKKEKRYKRTVLERKAREKGFQNSRLTRLRSKLRGSSRSRLTDQLRNTKAF